MNRTVVSWSLENLITINIMVIVMAVAIGFLANTWRARQSVQEA